jgi:predicted polyphosphate/ATP-dependent NAD kinase
MTGIAGIIANPASGRDIRRLVAHASVFGNDEKMNIVCRVILGMAAAGVDRVLYMPDSHRLVERAFEEIEVSVEPIRVDGDFAGDARDTAIAAASMQAAGASVIVSLGGDGTNRMLVKGAADVPLVPISTGTNNVFPVMVEGTVAGLAAGALAARAVDPLDVAPRCKLVEIDLSSNGQESACEIALIDAVVMEPGFVGSRAIWETDAIREIVLTRAEASAVGMSALGGMLEPVAPADDFGLHLVLAQGDGIGEDQGIVEVNAAIAPGLIQPVTLARVERVDLGASITVSGPALLAFDGEREVVLAKGCIARLSVARSGPPVVDISRCLDAAREAGFLRRGQAAERIASKDGS